MLNINSETSWISEKVIEQRTNFRNKIFSAKAFDMYSDRVVIDSSRLDIESVFVELKLFYECESEVLAKDK